MPAGETRHWLLSTEKTLRHFGIKSYRGKSFSWNVDWNKHPTEKSIWLAFKRAFNHVIIPNALIAMDAGFDVSENDCTKALTYLFARDTKRSPRYDAWTVMVNRGGNPEAWLERNIYRPFRLFVHGQLKDGKFVKKEYKYTLEKYLRKPGVDVAVKDNPEVKSSSPKRDMLVEAIRKDPSIAAMGYREIMEKFGIRKRSIVSEALKMAR